MWLDRRPCARMLAELEVATDLYLGAIAQARLPAWCRDRVVLLGDAAYCPSPLSGQGTSLALVGAYVLSEEISRSNAQSGGLVGYDGLASYERRMRPFVALNQAVALDNGSGIDHAKAAFNLDE